MMKFTEIRTATLDELTDELAAACWDSTQTELTDAREAVARLIEETQGLDLLSDEDDVIRAATADEAAESCHTADGWIEVDGRRCYVAS
jgi:hypothetical protein